MEPPDGAMPDGGAVSTHQKAPSENRDHPQLDPKQFPPLATRPPITTNLQNPPNSLASTSRAAVIDGRADTRMNGVYADAIAKQIGVPNHHKQSAKQYVSIASRQTRHGGMPAVIFKTSQYYGPLAQNCSNILVGKFMNTKPAIDDIRIAFNKKFKLRGKVFIGAINGRTVSLEFTNEEDRNNIYFKRSIELLGRSMWVQKWSPDLKSGEDHHIAPLWVSLPDLPLHLFDWEAIQIITAQIGMPLEIDRATEFRTRPSMAKVRVDVDLSKPVVRSVWIGTEDEDAPLKGFVQKIDYDYVPDYCTNCRLIGHTLAQCFKANRRRKQELSKKQGNYSEHVPENQYEEEPQVDGQNTNDLQIAKDGQPVVNTDVHVQENSTSPVEEGEIENDEEEKQECSSSLPCLHFEQAAQVESDEQADEHVVQKGTDEQAVDEVHRQQKGSELVEAPETSGTEEVVPENQLNDAKENQQLKEQVDEIHKVDAAMEQSKGEDEEAKSLARKKKLAIRPRVRKPCTKIITKLKKNKRKSNEQDHTLVLNHSNSGEKRTGNKEKKKHLRLQAKKKINKNTKRGRTGLLLEYASGQQQQKPKLTSKRKKKRMKEKEKEQITHFTSQNLKLLEQNSEPPCAECREDNSPPTNSSFCMNLEEKKLSWKERLSRKMKKKLEEKEWSDEESEDSGEWDSEKSDSEEESEEEEIGEEQEWQPTEESNEEVRMIGFGTDGNLLGENDDVLEHGSIYEVHDGVLEGNEGFRSDGEETLEDCDEVARQYEKAIRDGSLSPRGINDSYSTPFTRSRARALKADVLNSPYV